MTRKLTGHIDYYPVPPLALARGNCATVMRRLCNFRITCSEDNLVTKSAPLEYLRGELHFYQSIPPELVHLFPTLVEVNDDPNLAMPSMTMTKVRCMWWGWILRAWLGESFYAQIGCAE